MVGLSFFICAIIFLEECFWISAAISLLDRKGGLKPGVEKEIDFPLLSTNLQSVFVAPLSAIKIMELKIKRIQPDGGGAMQ